VLCAAAHNTYLPTWQGFAYVATVIDCCTKECIGYALADHMSAELVIDALRMAARNYCLEPGVIFHSDYAEPCVKPRDRVLACAGEVR
jgi:transposase InsO family protein